MEGKERGRKGREEEGEGEGGGGGGVEEECCVRMGFSHKLSVDILECNNKYLLSCNENQLKSLI